MGQVYQMRKEERGKKTRGWFSVLMDNHLDANSKILLAIVHPVWNLAHQVN
jgi:hypothetical protein